MGILGLRVHQRQKKHRKIARDLFGKFKQMDGRTKAKKDYRGASFAESNQRTKKRHDYLHCNGTEHIEREMEQLISVSFWNSNKGSAVSNTLITCV